MNAQPDDRTAPTTSFDAEPYRLPRSADLVTGFRAEADHVRDDTILGIARDLAANHQRQWDAEDACRASTATASDIGEAKVLIDELNSRRVEFVERLDELIEPHVGGAAGTPLHTETIGSVIDRLAIAWVRTDRLSRDPRQRERARISLRQLNELATAYDDLVRDLAAGRRRLPAWRALKSYGSTI